MTNFWKNLEKPFFILAPMEAVTDVVFRQVVKKAAPPDIYFTEFTNATGWVNAGEKATAGRLDKTNNEKPIVAQLWGADADHIEKLAIHCKDLGFDGIDINMGCPDKSAIKTGGGAALIKNHKLAADIIASAKKCDLPVSVKTRLGYSSLEEMEEWIGFLLQQNLSALTVHLRTKKEMSKVPAHWELLEKIVYLKDNISPATLIVANGDINSLEQAKELIKDKKIDGVMIGRGVFQNPFLFEKVPKHHTKHELLSLLNLHLDLYDKRPGVKRPFETLKRFFKIYVRDFEGAAELRNELMQTKNTQEARTVLVEHKL